MIPGPGSEVGNAIVEHELTERDHLHRLGARSAGASAARSPHKKVNLELGSNAPLIVNDDGDWETAADKAQIHAFSHAGPELHLDPADPASTRRSPTSSPSASSPTSRSLVVGDPMDEDTDVGPLISRGDRDRVKEWVDEAVAGGGELLTGGELVDEDRCLAPTVLERARRARPRSGARRSSARSRRSTRFTDFDEALELANDSKFGLQAGVFTRDIGRGLEAAQHARVRRRADQRGADLPHRPEPYGGVKDSGNTREGPAYAVRELTEERLVTLQG